MDISTLRTEVLPARFGRAVQVAAGASLVVVNTHGTQVVDFWAFVADDLEEYLSMEHSRSRLNRLIPALGDTLVTNRRRACLTLAEDTSPGIHDTLLCACNEAIYRELGCEEGHRSCQSNLHEALGELSLTVPFTPGPFNLFMNVPLTPEGMLDRAPPQTRPGDHVRLRAELDLVMVMSACPQDVTPINGAGCTPADVAFAVV